MHSSVAPTGHPASYFMLRCSAYPSTGALLLKADVDGCESPVGLGEGQMRVKLAVQTNGPQLPSLTQNKCPGRELPAHLPGKPLPSLSSSGESSPTVLPLLPNRPF